MLLASHYLKTYRTVRLPLHGGRQSVPIDTQHTGTVGCVLEVVQTGTTLITMAGPSSTEVKILPTTLTTLTTSVLAAPTDTKANSIDTSCPGTGTRPSTTSNDTRARISTSHKAGVSQCHSISVSPEAAISITPVAVDPAHSTPTIVPIVTPCDP
ncbi:hypothetical protein F4802DRAFT_578567 [Xylaria palmicola]|nr:hypothetical protein F4802DRAFT_578567 [Xylaria palmicola]